MRFVRRHKQSHGVVVFEASGSSESEDKTEAQFYPTGVRERSG